MKEKIASSVIAAKITRRMMKIYFLIYFGILAVLFSIMTLLFYNSSNTQMINTLSAMNNELQDMQDSLYDYSNTLLYSYDLITALERSRKENTAAAHALVKQSLSAFVASNYRILAVSVEDKDHNFYSSSYYTNIIDQSFLSEDDRYQNFLDYANGSYYSYYGPDAFYTEPTEYVDSPNEHHVLVLTRIMRLGGKLYAVRVYYDMTSLISGFDLQFSDVLSEYALLAQDGLVYSSEGAHEKDAQFWEDTISYMQIKGQGFVGAGRMYYQKNLSSGWIIVIYVTVMQFFHTILLIFGIIGILYIISPILYGHFLRPTAARLLAPLRQLRDVMQTYSAGDEVTVKIETKDEIEDLSIVFNRMTEKIKNQIEDIQRQEHEKSVVQYKFLATQIDPHFVYNTMNIINIMARQGKTEEIIEINSSLIRILRERLSTKLSIFTTIQDELDTLHEYDRIMQYRYESRIHIQIDADPGLMHYRIPKNILQPMVENSFYHGFSNLEEGHEGNIDILIYSIDKRIEIEISDDGSGIPTERLEMLRDHSYRIYDDQKPHIGLDNIQQRLEYLFHGDYQFEIVSKYGYGTTISISVPMDIEDEVT